MTTTRTYSDDATGDMLRANAEGGDIDALTIARAALADGHEGTAADYAVIHYECYGNLDEHVYGAELLALLQSRL